MQALSGDGMVVPLDKAEYELLRRKAERGVLTKLHRNLFVFNEAWDRQNPHKRIRRLAEVLNTQKYPKEKVYCVTTAAVLWGFDVPFRLITGPQLDLVGDPRGNRPNSMRRYFAIKSPRLVTDGRITYTDAVQTLCDCAHLLSFQDSLAIIESAMRTGALQGRQRELRERMQSDSKFAYVYSHASPTTESVGESIAKATILELGFQTPLQQMTFLPTHPSDTGGPYRVDFLWGNAGQWIAGEFDGVGKYYEGGDNVHSQVSRTVAKERERDANLHKRGITRVLHFDYHMVLDTRRFERILTEGGVPRER